MKIRNREIRRLAHLAEEAGWTVRSTRNGHIQFVPPEGPIITTGSTPSDHRAVLNLISQLRRGGLDIPRRGR